MTGGAVDQYNVLVVALVQVVLVVVGAAEK